MTSKRALVNLIIEAESVNANEQRISFLSNKIEKDLEDFEWLKSKLNLVFLDTLNNLEDKIRVLKMMGIDYKEWLENEHRQEK